MDVETEGVDETLYLQRGQPSQRSRGRFGGRTKVNTCQKDVRSRPDKAKTKEKQGESSKPKQKATYNKKLQASDRDHCK
jgi:hypothetical protein